MIYHLKSFILIKVTIQDTKGQDRMDFNNNERNNQDPNKRKKNKTNGKYQEKEGILLAEEFLKDTDLPEKIKKRVVFLVGHHHTLTGIDGIVGIE